MSDWTSGYVSEIDYTYGYYPELNPQRVKLAFLHAGLVPPVVEQACELGFGQGLSFNIHAAASGTRWTGTDFNPAQASHAMSLASASGAPAKALDDSFADFAERSDLPDFDYIGLHGIWSWVSDENRRIIVDVVRRKLKPGGVLYISYNTQPGWAGMVPVRQLMTEHARLLAAPGQSIATRIDGAIAFAEKLVAQSPAFARLNPGIAERLKKIKDQGRNYLAHEYFNRDWLPMSVAEMGQWLAPAKLSYACSAHYLDHIAGLNLNADQQALLREVADPMFAEMVRDFMVNQQFRRDYWVKGARRLTGGEQLAEILKLQVLLVTPRADVTLKVASAQGEAGLQDTVYNPILDALADQKPRTVRELESIVKPKGLTVAQLVAGIMILIGKGDVVAVQDPSAQSAAASQSSKLNSHIMAKAGGGGNISFLASPVTGGGIGVSRFQQVFLTAIAAGKQTPQEWARFAWAILAAQGQQIVKEGKALQGEEANLAELLAQANEFAAKRLATLKALKIL